MRTEGEIFDAIAGHLRASYGARIRYKDESRLMRAIGALLFFNRSFATDYTTTLGRTIYFPTRECAEGPDPWWEVLAHEGVHVHDYCAAPVRFVLWYAFPQCLALLALLAIGAVWWLPMLGFLAFLVALAPWRAPGRARLERRGYTMSMVCDALRRGSAHVRSTSYQEWMIQVFSGPAYYWMDGRESLVERRVARDAEAAVRYAQGQESLGAPVPPVFPLVRRLFDAT